MNKTSLALFLILVAFYTPDINATSTTFTFEPESLTVPFYDGAFSAAFILELKVTNAIDLKEFHIDFAYDNGVIEYIDGVIDQSFYVKTEAGEATP